MASELRVIRFRLDEVSAAVKALAAHLGLQVPARTILQVYAAPDGTPNTLLRYGGPDADIAIGNNSLAACLIVYCRRAGIPLPRAGEKLVQALGGHVDLRIVMQDAHLGPEAVVRRDAGTATGAQAF